MDDKKKVDIDTLIQATFESLISKLQNRGTQHKTDVKTSFRDLVKRELYKLDMSYLENKDVKYQAYISFESHDGTLFMSNLRDVNTKDVIEVLDLLNNVGVITIDNVTIMPTL